MLPTSTPQSPRCFAEHQNSDLENCDFWILDYSVRGHRGIRIWKHPVHDVVNVIHSMESSLKMEDIPLSVSGLYKTLPAFYWAFLVPCLTSLIWGKSMSF